MGAVEEVKKWCGDNKIRMSDFEEAINTSISPFLSEAIIHLQEKLEGKDHPHYFLVNRLYDLFNYTIWEADKFVEGYDDVPPTLVRWVGYTANAYWLTYKGQYEEALKELEKMADEVYPVWEWLRKELGLPMKSVEPAER